MTKTSWFPAPAGLGVRGDWIRLGLGEGTEVYQPEKDTPSVPRTCRGLGAGGSWYGVGKPDFMAEDGALGPGGGRQVTGSQGLGGGAAPRSPSEIPEVISRHGRSAGWGGDVTAEHLCLLTNMFKGLS